MDPTPAELAWLRLALTNGVGPQTVRALLDSGAEVGRLEEDPPSFGPLLGRGGRARRLLEAMQRVHPERTWRAAARLGQRVLTPASAGWPSGELAALEDPPSALFLRGRLPPPEAPVAAIVGTREAGPYGRKVARRIAEDLARVGCWIVSGFAEGIDGAAHEGALAAGRGGTLGVLGCGVDVSYPLEHAALREEMAAEGGLLSEHAPGVGPHPGHFPRRNRLVAALARAVIVVEAPTRSGALITAQRALQMGREILVVPGPVTTPGFRGGHLLLKQGSAHLCEGAGDVLAALGVGDGPVPGVAPRAPPPAGAPLALFGVLGPDETVAADELCRRTGLDVEDVATGLAILEIEGYVARVPGLGVRRL